MAVNDYVTKRHFIYSITFPNGKKYIGLTCNFKARKSAHLNPYIHKKYKNKLYSAIKSYGKENLQWDILICCFDRESAIFYEKYYISKYDTQNIGYNMTPGGDGANFGRIPWNKGISMTEEIRQKVINSRRGQKTSRIYKKGIPGYWTGKKRSKEVIEKLFRGKKIICLNDNKIFISVIEAAKYYNLHYTNISRVALGKRKSTGGLKFKYIEVDNVT
jgi:group I intron endonuclease